MTTTLVDSEQIFSGMYHSLADVYKLFCFKLFLSIMLLIFKWHWRQVHPNIHVPCQWKDLLDLRSL